MYLFILIFIHLSANQSINLSIYPSIHLRFKIQQFIHIHPSVHRLNTVVKLQNITICLYLTFHYSIYLSIHPSIHPSIHSAIHLLIYLCIPPSLPPSVHRLDAGALVQDPTVHWERIPSPSHLHRPHQDRFKDTPTHTITPHSTAGGRG